MLKVRRGRRRGVGADEKNDDVLTTLNTLVVGGKVGFDTRSGKAVERAPLKAVTNLVDAVTGEIVGKGTVRMNVSADGSDPDLRSCIKDGKNKRLTAYAPANRYLTSDKGTVHFQYHSYRIEKARRLEYGQSTQWEVCSTGGGDLDGDRLRQVGTGIALAEANNFRKVGQAWQTGKTPEDYTLGLGFELKKEPVAISASLSQNPSDKLLGSIRGPFRTFMDGYDRNAVNAWWQDNCIGRWYGCLRNSFDGVSGTPFALFTRMIRPEAGHASVGLVASDGSERSFTLAPRVGTARSGKKLIAIGVLGSEDVNAPATETVLLNPKSGRATTVDGWAPLAWARGRTTLLVVRAADTRLPDSELAVLDPAEPDQPQILGTIPGLTFFQASWVERSPSAS